MEGNRSNLKFNVIHLSLINVFLSFRRRKWKWEPSVERNPGKRLPPPPPPPKPSKFRKQTNFLHHEKKLHIKYMTASFNFYIRKKKQMTLRCCEHLCIYYGQEVRIEKKHLPPPSQRSPTFNQGFFSQLFNWFQLFSSDKKNSPKVAVHNKKKASFGRGVLIASASFHWFSVILFSNQNHPCLMYDGFLHFYIP